MYTPEEQAIIDQALSILSSKMAEKPAFTDPATTASFCQLKLASKEYEVFGVLFLNTQNQLIDFQEMFRGTIDCASVYPREVVKAALVQNAAAVIFTHNHPSGVAEPSRADRTITTRLQEALKLIDIRTLDHIVVSQSTTVSFAERGWL